LNLSLDNERYENKLRIELGHTVAELLII
jgi:hypothetical protein